MPPPPSFPTPDAFRTGCMTFDLPSARLETSFLRGHEDSRTLVVWFHAALDRPAMAIPVFVGASAAYSGLAHQIAVADPTHDRNENIRAGWYMGDMDFDAQSEISTFFRNLRKALNIERMIYVGASSGGFAALHFSLLDDGSCALALQPQVNAGAYFYFLKYVSLAWPGHSIEQVGAARCVDLNKRYQNGFRNTVIYLQSTADNEHFLGHMMPFFSAAAKAGGKAGGLISHVDYWGQLGHAPIPPNVVDLWLRSAITAPSLSAEDILQTCHTLRQQQQRITASPATERPAKALDPAQIALADRIRAFQLGQ